jgi:hypothetical protein
MRSTCDPIRTSSTCTPTRSPNLAARINGPDDLNGPGSAGAGDFFFSPASPAPAAPGAVRFADETGNPTQSPNVSPAS